MIPIEKILNYFAFKNCINIKNIIQGRVDLPESGDDVCWYAEAGHTKVRQNQIQQDHVEVGPQLIVE